MTLWLVTWEPDLTQFLVNAKTETGAIDAAMTANIKLEDVPNPEDIYDRTTYSVDAVDMSRLCDIIKYRKDVWDVVDDVVCYVG